MDNVSCEVGMSIFSRKYQYKTHFFINSKFHRKRSQDAGITKKRWKNTPRKRWASEVDFGWFWMSFGGILGSKRMNKPSQKGMIFLVKKWTTKKTKKVEPKGLRPSLTHQTSTPWGPLGGRGETTQHTHAHYLTRPWAKGPANLVACFLCLSQQTHEYE